MPKIDLDAIKGPVVLLQEPSYQGDLLSSRLCTVLRREGDCLLVHVKNGNYHAELDADGGFHPLKLGVTRGVYARMWEDHTPAFYEVAWQGDLPFDPSDFQRAIDFIEATIEAQGVDWQADPTPAPGR